MSLNYAILFNRRLSVVPVNALSMYSRTMRKLLRSAKARHSANCPSMDCSFCAWELKRA